MPLENLGAGQPLGCFLNDLKLDDYRLSDAFDIPQAGGGGCDDAVKIAEPFQQFARQRFDIPARNRAEKNEFQHLIIRHGRCAAVDETAAQTLSMICDIRGLLARVGRRFARFVHEEGKGLISKGSRNTGHAQNSARRWLGFG